MHERDVWSRALGILFLALLVLVLTPSLASAEDGGGTQEMTWVSPVKGQPVCQPGYSYYEYYAQYGFETHHTGCDIPAMFGTPVRSRGNGTVVLVQYGWNTYAGWDVFVYHGTDPQSGLPYYTFYAHMSGVRVVVGQRVRAGEVIGQVGSAGTGPHLHFGASNLAPEEFGGRWYVHASENGGRGWINPANPPKYLIVDEKVYHPSSEEVVVEKVKGELKELKTTFKISWGKLGILLLVGLVVVTLKSLGLSLRTQVGLVGVGLLVYAWVLPQTTTWLASPFGETAVKIVDFYGDVRRVATGQTALVYSVPEGTEVRSVVGGRVVEYPDSFSVYGKQVWVEVGNGLYVQYANLQEVWVEPGEKVRIGQVIGLSSGQLRLGVSSKPPYSFHYVDDRSFGWMNPEEFLGHQLMSGVRRQEAWATQWGWIFLLLAIFWPKRRLRQLVARWGLDLAPPYGSDWFYHRGYLLTASLVVEVVGVLSQSPWLEWLAITPLVVSVIYFLDRRWVRNKIRRGREFSLWWRWFAHTMMSVVWVVWVIALGLAGLLYPPLTVAKAEVELALPTVVTPPLPVLEESVVSHSVVEYDSGLPEFLITYWNGTQVRFYIDPKIWEAAKKAQEEYSYCDPRLAVAVAFSESPHYSRYAVSYAGAAGPWQFMPGTWQTWAPNPSIPRSDPGMAARAFCRYAKAVGLFSAKTESEFVQNFAYRAPVWNMHAGQARFVWRAWQELKERIP